MVATVQFAVKGQCPLSTNCLASTLLIKLRPLVQEQPERSCEKLFQSILYI